jgi:dethiobiotin synthetase
VSRRLVITGTDIGVGKTVVSAAVVRAAAAAGLRVAYVKPVQTGVVPGEPGDAEDVRRLTGVGNVHELVRLRDPLAPRTAARIAGVRLPAVAELARRVRALDPFDLVVVEGAGGLLVQLDDDAGTLVDLARHLDAPVLVVAHAGLGTLSATALTCAQLRRDAVRCAGLVVGAWPGRPGLAERCNLVDLPTYAGAPLLGVLPEDLGQCDADTFGVRVAEHLAGPLAPLLNSGVDRG